MKFPLHVEYGDDPNEVEYIKDTDNKTVVVCDSGVYPPKKESAEFIVAACNAHAQRLGITEVIDEED